MRIIYYDRASLPFIISCHSVLLCTLKPECLQFISFLDYVITDFYLWRSLDAHQICPTRRCLPPRYLPFGMILSKAPISSISLIRYWPTYTRTCPSLMPTSAAGLLFCTRKSIRHSFTHHKFNCFGSFVVLNLAQQSKLFQGKLFYGSERRFFKFNLYLKFVHHD